jgi:hypothetical protein
MTHALVEAAQMSSASINDLPDSAFAYIESGGSKDSEGKTVPRSLRHFPIHDEAHVRNALARAPQSPFGDKAMPKIRAAAKKFGIQVSDVKAAAGSDLFGVELARPGPWKVAAGDGNFTAQMLRDAADFYVASGGQAVPVKLGHTDDRFAGDGDPAFGSVINVRYVEDDRGPVLLGDITGMPEWLSASATQRWPNRSVEGWQNFTYDGREYSLVLTGLAFLGATPPAVRTIRSLADLQTALAASSAVRLVASAPPDDPATPPQAPAPEVGESTEEMEAGLMDPAKIREALGLPADASDDEVKAGLLSAAGVTPQSTPPPEPVAAAAAPEPETTPEPVTGAPGTMLVASSVWDETQDTIKRLQAFVAKSERAERDQVIAQAVQDGKFTPAQKPHFAKLWDADPKGTRAVIDSLTRNSALAVMASGYAGGGDEIDEYAALYGKAKVG